jgi:hypothetical protein
LNNLRLLAVSNSNAIPVLHERQVTGSPLHCQSGVVRVLRVCSGGRLQSLRFWPWRSCKDTLPTFDSLIWVL